MVVVCVTISLEEQILEPMEGKTYRYTILVVVKELTLRAMLRCDEWLQTS